MLQKIRHSIVGRILTGYAAIILLAFITTLVSMYSAWQNRKVDQRVSDTYYPMVLSLKESEMLASESYKLTNNWIYQPNNAEKDKLRAIHARDAAIQKDKLAASARELDETSAAEIRAIQESFDALLSEQLSVMSKLNHDTAYSNDVLVDEAIVAMEKKITPAYETLTDQISKAGMQMNGLLENANAKKEASSRMLFYLYVTNIVLFLIIGLYAVRFSITSISKPIAELSALIITLSRGKFVPVTLKKSRDEIGRMAEALQNMLTGLKGKVEFAENIGKGQYESDFEMLSEDDTMGRALIQMRTNLKQAADEDRKRNWATEGLAKFADILQSRNENLSQLADTIISSLVKYMGVNQGALFLINDEDSQHSFIELVACYAYDRKKYINKRIEIGEGLTGQCILEKETIYMSDIPGDYLKITSGLGDALPKNLLIVPLKLNDNIFGVVEIASFQTIEPYQIEFVEKLGESIASTISSVKINSRTKRLLEETQVQAEQMRAQEEEMRQNMEELSATQEEMHRAQRRSEEALEELKEKERNLIAINERLSLRENIVSSNFLISETDIHGNIIYVNDRMCETSGFTQDDLLDASHNTLRHEEMPAGLFKTCWSAIKKGKTFNMILKNRRKNQEAYWIDLTIVPARNERDELVRYVGLGRTVDDEEVATIRYNLQADAWGLPRLDHTIKKEATIL